MSTQEHVLYAETELVIKLIIEDTKGGDQAFVKIVSSDDGPDLSSEEDVIVVLNGQGVPITDRHTNCAVASLGSWMEHDTHGAALMIRVDELLEGWDFEPHT